ncbi:carboxypeptidase-like regulatory domain-containing protein [Persicobacter diffluens]|uniref:SusC/RagA family TonB-linked outer membrane protein n=1 Tax=Persicobacter diffluens TaxID=981 RepID=A0AAN5AI26_9BACT|nr:hypothetical protein PEDI_05170 [Persicobacter diffluens]
MKKALLMAFAMLLTMSAAFAQGRVVTGTVTAEENGDPIPGVNVLIKGQATGTVTDIEGKYSIQVPDAKSVLVFTFIGLANEEVVVGGQSKIDMTMTADIKQLTEVVVTALGIEREEKSLGYAIQQVDGLL